MRRSCACSQAGPCILHDGTWRRLALLWCSSPPIVAGQAWDPCDTVHPGPVGYEMVARAIALPYERARLLGVLLARAG